MAAAEGVQLAQQSKPIGIFRAFVVVFFEPEVRAWSGGARFSTLFWLQGVLASSALIALYIASIYAGEMLVEQALLIFFGLYTIWVLVSIWRCSFAADPFWGLLARWLTIAWAANAALVLFFSQLELWARNVQA